MPIKYQPHIDILRALAVFLVILSHLEFSFFSGGYIGVDVFFVISGYLITHNIIKEKYDTGTFSFKNFYRKRVIRLAPAFFTVLIICTINFLFIMTNNEIEAYLKTVISALTLSSNIYFSILLNDYFSISAKSTPLLHFWSLSLEEQFYLFWPLFFILIHRFRRKYIFIIVLAVLSLLFSHLTLQKNSIIAYYLLPSRAFEFLIGALVALAPQKKYKKNTSTLLGIIIILSLILTSHIINPKTLFPSYNALIPCGLTALYIYTAQNLNSKYLHTINYLGKISYPLYLWHWPIIVYFSLLSIKLSLPIKILVIILSIFLSILTYEFIEKKIKKINLKPIRSLLILPSSTILLFCIIYPIYTKQSSQQLTKKITSNDSTLIVKCIDQDQHPRDDCVFGDKNKKNIEIFLVGDSHSNAQSGFIDYLANHANKRGYEITFSSTAFLPFIDRSTFNSNTKQLELVTSFTQLNRSVLQILQSQQPKFVVMSGYFPHNWNRSTYSSEQFSTLDSKQAFTKGLQNAIHQIEKIGAKPILINDNPILIDIDINCNLRVSYNDCSFPHEKHISDFSEWNNLLRNLKKQYPNLIIIDFNDIICKNERCYSSLNNIPLYRDNQHLSYRGSKEIAIEYLKTHENPFKYEFN